jgi:hypothetical protein
VPGGSSVSRRAAPAQQRNLAFISKMVFAPEPSGFPDDIAQPIGELRVRLFTTHFA